MNLVYLWLGSNLSNPLRQLNQAIEALHALPRSLFVSHTTITRTNPWGGVRAQPDYYNSIAVLLTALPPKDLLFYCQRIELSQGRIRRVRWGARTLDIDILIYEKQKIHSNQLVLPHPQIQSRDFVLNPLREICPNYILKLNHRNLY